MKSIFRALAIIAIAAVIGFSMIACGDGGGGSTTTNNPNTPSGGGDKLNGTYVQKGTYSSPMTLIFNGSNYSFTSSDKESSGTYTLAANGKDLAFKETSPGSTTYKGYYFSDKDEVTADFLGHNADFKKQE